MPSSSSRDRHSEPDRALRQGFRQAWAAAQGTDCPAIDGLIEEANATAGEIEDKAVLDASIVANSQVLEHYKFSRYGTLIAWAEELGRIPNSTALCFAKA